MDTQMQSTPVSRALQDLLMKCQHGQDKVTVCHLCALHLAEESRGAVALNTIYHAILTEIRPDLCEAVDLLLQVVGLNGEHGAGGV